MFTHTNNIDIIDLKAKTGPKGRFYTTPEGAKYPSITTLLGSGEKKWLTEWRNSLGPAKADKETKRAADRGTAVHLMAERHLQNDPNPTFEQTDSHIAEFNSLRMYLRKVDNILCQEAALYSDTLQVAGRVDCIGDYAKELSIIDFKTSTNSKDDSMVEDYFLQTTAYAVMFQEQYDIDIKQVVIIMSVERGLPMVFKRSVDDYLVPLCERINTYYTNQRVSK